MVLEWGRLFLLSLWFVGVYVLGSKRRYIVFKLSFIDSFFYLEFDFFWVVFYVINKERKIKVVILRFFFVVKLLFRFSLGLV